ncbi:MAG: hypothetical protein OWU84_06230 [Firmicutes bacterium]|nr:hypothetical protein [Bacillota bacterium]
MNRFRLPSKVLALVRQTHPTDDLSLTLESLLEQTHRPETVVVCLADPAFTPSAALRPYLPYVHCCSPQSLTALPSRALGSYLMILEAGESLRATAIEALELVLDLHSEVALVHAAPPSSHQVPFTDAGGKYRPASTAGVVGPAVLSRLPEEHAQDALAMPREEYWQRLLREGHLFYAIRHPLGWPCPRDNTVRTDEWSAYGERVR